MQEVETKHARPEPHDCLPSRHKPSLSRSAEKYDLQRKKNEMSYVGHTEEKEKKRLYAHDINFPSLELGVLGRVMGGLFESWGD